MSSSSHKDILVKLGVDASSLTEAQIDQITLILKHVGAYLASVCLSKQTPDALLTHFESESTSGEEFVRNALSTFTCMLILVSVF